MRKPLKTFLLVRAALDENDVPYLVANPSMPARRVGIRHRDDKPATLDHFADHFEPFAHVVDASDVRHLAHYRSEERAGTLEVLGQCQAPDAAAALQKLQPVQVPAPPSPAVSAAERE